jgi:ABC-2 type transport system ATP-binding protein
VKTYGRLRALDEFTLNVAAGEIAELMQLTDVLGQPAGLLSGGVITARAAAGAAVVFTTHYLPELAELGATVAVARAGRVAARGNQAELCLDGLLPGGIAGRR